MVREMYDLVIGSDHGGVSLKKSVAKALTGSLNIHDFGVYNSDAVDYPDIALKVASFVASGQAKKGVLFCGTGIGMSIAANKIKGIRAALCHDEFTARLSREHNDANILVLGGRVLGQGLANAIVNVWLKTAFAGDRHQARLDKISAIEGS